MFFDKKSIGFCEEVGRLRLTHDTSQQEGEEENVFFHTIDFP